MSAASLAERVAALRWYHTIELAPGVETPGWYDLRPAAPLVPLPADLSGKRCLDVGTFDGFWALEMERRGAAEVVAVDVLDPGRWDWPPSCPPEVVREMVERKGHGNPGFALVREALGSKVELVDRSIYELDPGDLGEFDVVFCGSLLLHLRDPVLGLERLRSVCRGQLVVSDAVDPALGRIFRGRPVAGLDGIGRPWWWKPSPAGHVALVERAGFVLDGPPVALRLKPGRGQDRPRITARGLLTREGRDPIVTGLRGDPHQALRARPAF